MIEKYLTPEEVLKMFPSKENAKPPYGKIGWIDPITGKNTPHTPQTDNPKHISIPLEKELKEIEEENNENEM